VTPAYLSPKDVAELTGLSEKTIRRAYESGELAAFKPGGRVLIRADDVNVWIERHRILPTTAANGDRPSATDGLFDERLKADAFRASGGLTLQAGWFRLPVRVADTSRTRILKALQRNRLRREAAESELNAARSELRTLLTRGAKVPIEVATMAREAGISRETAHKALREAERERRKRR
jgi:excisionase family DNA binding protein